MIARSEFKCNEGCDWCMYVTVVTGADNMTYLLVSSFYCLMIYYTDILCGGARCSSVVRDLAQSVMGRRIDPSWGEPIELFLVPASAPQLV